MRDAMAQVSGGGAILPLRQFMAVPGTAGKMAVMPGALADPATFGVKIVSKFPRAPGDRHGTHVGAVLLFAASDGLPLALIDGASLTEVRTAATSAMATDLLSRHDARHLLILGAGQQARAHIAALRLVRPFDRVSIWARDRTKASALAGSLDADVVDDLEAGVAAADVICTTTSAAQPILRGASLMPGVHVNLVGSATAASAEADDNVVRRSHYYVDSLPAALAAAGELRNAIASRAVEADHVAGEIGLILLGLIAGRTTQHDITVYKSLGVTAQDLIAAHFVWSAALAHGLGAEIDLDD